MVSSEAGVVLAFAAVVLFACSPLLSIDRIRALFAWPTRWLAVNYLLVGAGVITVQCLSYLGVVLLTAGTGSVTGSDVAGILSGVMAVNFLVPGVSALAALRLLPARGYWTPDGDGLHGSLALALGVLWYAIVTTVAFLVIGLVVLFANLPT